MNEQPAPAFQHQAHALHEAALDLANVDARVERRANVHHNVAAQHAVLARQHVDLHLRALPCMTGAGQGQAFTAAPNTK